MTTSLHSVEAGDVAAVTLLGWLGASFFYAIGMVLFGMLAISGQEPGALVFLPIAIFMSIAATCLMSAPWVLPLAALLVFLLKLFGAAPRIGASVLLIAGVVYATFVSSNDVIELALPLNGIPAGLIYGSSLGLAYAKVMNG